MREVRRDRAETAGGGEGLKSYGQLWKRIASDENIRAGWLAFRRHHAGEPSVRAFAANLDANLAEIGERLRSGAWRPSGYWQFRITDPKPRTISCAPVRDRVVHHALCRVIAPLIERRMIAQSYACREGLGSHLACRRARELAAKHPYFLKLDVRHYFDSIGHDRLIALLAGMFREREVRGILEAIIRHPLRGQREGRGLPIGNLTSQWFANLYLDALDHAVTETLGFGGRYIRYMDDLLVFADTKAEAWAARDFIADWLGRERGLSLKERSTVVAPVTEGVPFLGLRIHPGAWRFSRSRFLRTRRSARRHYRAFLDGRESEAKLQTVVSAMEGAVGWYGFKGILRGVEESSLRTAAGEGDSSDNRVNRGGYYNDNADNCRPSNRNNDNADNDGNNVGFRLSSICEPTGGRQDRKSHPARPELRAGCEAEHARHRRTSQRAIPAQRPTSITDKRAPYTKGVSNV